MPRFIVLAILDGWGIAAESPGNAITKANTPNMDKFWLSYPHTQLEASGDAVGLPRGEDGNTETGHLNLGAGKIVYQDLQRINMAIIDGTFSQNQVLLSAIEHAKKNESCLHIMGLVGAGGVHSNLDHLFALIHMCVLQKIKNVSVHAFTDGRDSPPTAAKSYIKRIQDYLEKEKVGAIASVMGRYWAMDRDQRWDRTSKAYFALTKGEGRPIRSPEEAIDLSYKEGKTDEFIEPSIVVNEEGKPISVIKPGDSVIFYNFRIDRPRQLTKSFVYDDFTKANIFFDVDPYATKFKMPELVRSESEKRSESFKRGPKIRDLLFVTMTDYGKTITDGGAMPAFPPEVISAPISSVISTAGLRQLKITESEKERFVTFYFNGLRDKPYPLEERVIVPSLKITTYDQKPQMSANEVTTKLISKLETLDYQFAVVNYPNADMVGHTGNFGPSVTACEVVDECVGKLSNFCLAYDGLLIITADHGNAEEMINLQTGEIDTEHSTNPVPFIAISKTLLGKSQTLRSGILADIAPTILSAMNLPMPTSMTGRNLLGDVMGI